MKRHQDMIENISQRDIISEAIRRFLPVETKTSQTVTASDAPPPVNAGSPSIPDLPNI